MTNNHRTSANNQTRVKGIKVFFNKLFRKRLPLYYVFIFAIASFTFLFIYELEISARSENIRSKQKEGSASLGNSGGNITTDNEGDAFTKLDIFKLKGYSLTRPIVFADNAEESKRLPGLKEELNAIIKDFTGNKILRSASIYIEDLTKGDWIDINTDEGFHPASLMKLTILISYLKRSETQPGILDKTLTLESNSYAPNQTFEEQNIQPGKPYKVSDLLFRMITHSDNFATSLLDRQLDTISLNTLFQTLKIEGINFRDAEYTLTSKDFSKLMIVLYNASFLNEKDSEKALWILTQTNFSKGLIKPIPKSILVAHKFGENSLRPLKELHESGIIYAGNRTYLLTVMTKGKDVTDLSDFISNVSGKVYTYFSQK